MKRENIRGSVAQQKRINRRQKELLEALKGAAKTGEFVLASGRKSNFYIDCRPVILQQKHLIPIGASIQSFAELLKVNTLAGPATAAIPIMTSAMMMMYTSIENIVYTRKKVKDHGTTQAVEGPPLGKDARIILVDDVLTTGGSLLRCGKAVQEAYPEANIVGAWVLVDRLDRGDDRSLEQEFKCILRTMFTRNDILL